MVIRKVSVILYVNAALEHDAEGLSKVHNVVLFDLFLMRFRAYVDSRWVTG